MKKLVIALFAVCILSFAVFRISMGTILFTAEGREKLMETSVQEQQVSSVGVEDIKVTKLGSSRITILPVDGEAIIASLQTQYVSSGSLPQLNVTVEGRTVEVKVIHQPTVGIVWFLDTELTVYVPRAYSQSLSITAGSGNTKVTGLTLDKFGYNGTSGHLRTEALTARLADLSSSSGSMKLYQFVGDLKSSALSGDTHVEFKEFGKHQVSMFASSGDITIRMPDGAGYNLDASTSSGRITTHFPVSFVNPNRLKVDVGSGEGSVNLQTRSGKINISR